MSDVFNVINSIFSKYGLGGVIIVCIVWGTYLILKSEWFSNLWYKVTDIFVDFLMKKRIREVKNTSISESEIKHHEIFNYIDLWTNSKIPTLHFSTDYRTIVFRRYLNIYLKSYKTNMQTFIQSGDYKKMDNSELWKSMMSIINTIISDYEKNCEDQNIPKLLVLKVKIKNNDTIHLLIDLIENISTSNFYESNDNLLKMYSILNILLSVLESWISNSQTVLNGINGQIKGFSIIENGKIYTEP